MTHLMAVWAWILTNKIEVLVVVWLVLNVLWAQCPPPKNPTLAKLWNALHSVLQLVVTPAVSKGTFKLPWVLDALVKASLSATEKPVAPASPPPPPANSTFTANNAGDDNAKRSP